MDKVSQSATSEGSRFLDELYDKTVRNGGPALQFRLFDVQLCDSLSEEWLRGILQSEGITSEEADWMIAGAFLRSRQNARGERGYILYTPYQAEVLKKLKQTGRYDTEELRHIMSDWDDYLEAIVMEEPGYDDESVPDYEHFKRRALEMLALFEEDDGQERPSRITLEQWENQQADSKEKLLHWREVCQIVDTKTEDQLDPQLRDCLHRQLFHLRWWDEFVRLNMAKQFDTAVCQGYSTEVCFCGFSSQGGDITLQEIDWQSSLRMYRQTRREGFRFPLRTPAFNVTEHGLEFLVTPSPEKYAELYTEYRLDSLASALAEIGPSLWGAQDSSTGDGACLECQAPFPKTSPRRAYCSDACRIRAKSRRWRRNDPERARKTQARYWKSAYPDLE